MEQTTQNKESLQDITFLDPSEFIEFIPEGSEPSEDQSGENNYGPNPLTQQILEAAESNVYSDEDDKFELTNEIESSIDYVIKKQEDTRGRLALIYTIATFSFFALGFLVAILDGLSRHVSIIDNLKEILPLLSGIFLGSLGFVLGYYFRKSEENNTTPSA